MIISFWLTLLYGFVAVITAPLRLLADVTVNQSIAETIGTVSRYLRSINDVVPVDHFLTALALIVTIELGIATYKVIMWIIHLVRGSG